MRDPIAWICFEFVAFRDEFREHLKRFPSAPFIFVGAGLPRRYLGLDGWEALLRRYADLAGQPYEYYSSTADGSYPKIASLIAADLHEAWWKEPAFEESRKYFQGETGGSQWALKAEIAKDLAESLDHLPKRGPLADELTKLRAAVIDGIITTNYDLLLEALFPDFEVFVGQDEMLFAHPQGVGELYKIHGSVNQPDSLVLTEEDYVRFEERNSYLAAKLLTVFVEHPVVFVGYSLTDRNVFAILRSIASVLTNENIAELQDRLLFIEWSDELESASTLGPIPFVADSYTIPMLGARVPDFNDVFDVLGELDRRFPARVLRQLKERVYELVRTNDPKQKLFVQDLEPGMDASEVDVVLGVGAIEKQLAHSYKGLNRSDLAEDVLRGGTELDPRRVVTEVLPGIAKNTHAPVFKYLREAGLLEDDGSLRDKASVDKRVADRVENFAAHFRVPTSYKKRAEAAASDAGDFKTLARDYDPLQVLLSAGLLAPEKQDTVALRRFLLAHREPADGDVGFYRTNWFKGVCLYDYLQNAHRSRSPRRRKRTKRARAKAK